MPQALPFIVICPCLWNPCLTCLPCLQLGVELPKDPHYLTQGTVRHTAKGVVSALACCTTQPQTVSLATKSEGRRYVCS